MPSYVLGMSLCPPLYCASELTLSVFQYASDVAEMQWIGEFSAIQQAEFCEHEEEKKLITGHSGDMDPIDEPNEQVEAFLSLTNLQLPPGILSRRQCILEANAPIRTGTTCDIYAAAFSNGVRIAKKVFRIGTSEKEHMQKYAEVCLSRNSPILSKLANGHLRVVVFEECEALVDA